MIESDWDKLCDCTDELMATGLYPSRYEAMKEAQRRNPNLDRTPPGMTAMTPTARPASTGNAEAELDRWRARPSPNSASPTPKRTAVC